MPKPFSTSSSMNPPSDAGLAPAAASDMVRVTIDIPADKQAAFEALWAQILSGAETPVTRRVATSQADRKTIATAGQAALQRLYVIAMRGTGQSRVVAKFLAGLYNGHRFPFDLTDLRLVDTGIFEDCMALLCMDARQCTQEVHHYFADGQQKWEQMIRDWDLGKSGT